MKNVALISIDLMSDFEFPGGKQLRAALIKTAPNIRQLQGGFRRNGLPVIYANDNYGRWRDDFRAQMRRVAAASTEGRKLVETFKPARSDHFVLKPHRSAFYKTPLGHLLKELNIQRLVFIGQTTDMCVAATAIDARMREFDIFVPPDCCVANKPAHHDQALRFLRRTCDAKCLNAKQLIEHFTDEYGAKT